MTQQIYEMALAHYQREQARFLARAEKFMGHQKNHYATLARYAGSQAEFWRLKVAEEQERTSRRETRVERQPDDAG